MNRISRLVPQATKGPVSNMKLLLGSLAPSTIVPEVDKYYVFVYKAKTPRIKYDRHPFIVCTSIAKWGFTGYNFHWDDWRRYTWNEVLSNIYEIHSDELNDMQNFPITKIVST